MRDPPHDVHGDADEVEHDETEPETGLEHAEIEADDRRQTDQDDRDEREPKRDSRIGEVEGVDLLDRSGCGHW